MENNTQSSALNAQTVESPTFFKKHTYLIILVLVALLVCAGLVVMMNTYSSENERVTSTLLSNREVQNVQRLSHDVSTENTGLVLNLEAKFLNSSFGTTTTTAFLVDLDNDGHADLLLRPTGPAMCGSGGCNLYVLRNTGKGFALIGYVTVVKTVYLGNTTTNGWRDIVIGYNGGGGTAGFSKMQFDGTAYPSNPKKEGVKIDSVQDLEQVW